ncbi:TrbG/VirB9 family P-type conjugative transfer protein [Rhodospirillum rubrum]|uniref:TrbG/VirB9 family P-type conjugative transfer protein n=1 Tax=Rhodospirillum rubrum TaxID=1085 RepID=UPI000037A53D|nr:P-type conjugative transfer protein TrbG [Rhodospirillum rubrum F11]
MTDVALQEGEQLVGSGPVAAGDTVRWIIGDTESGTGATKRIHILVKPTRPSLQTNVVINTDRRTYLLELHATARTYMASVSWQCNCRSRARKLPARGGGDGYPGFDDQPLHRASGG